MELTVADGARLLSRCSSVSGTHREIPPASARLKHSVGAMTRKEREGDHECAEVGFSFVGDVGSSGCDACLWARRGAGGRGSEQRYAKRYFHAGFLRHLGP